MGIPLIVNTSSGIMNTDSGHREHSPERTVTFSMSQCGREFRLSLIKIDIIESANLQNGSLNVY